MNFDVNVSSALDSTTAGKALNILIRLTPGFDCEESGRFFSSYPYQPLSSRDYKSFPMALGRSLLLGAKIRDQFSGIKLALIQRV